MRTIDKIILHYTATYPESTVTVGLIDQWHRKRGWKNGIGYHYVIYENGEVHKGREIDLIGSHTKGQNKSSIGVAYVGGLDSEGVPRDTMTMQQELSWLQLVNSIRLLFGHCTVHGHNEFSSKACPGFNVQEKYKFLNS